MLDYVGLALMLAAVAGLMIGYRQARGKDFKIADERLKALAPIFAGLVLAVVLMVGGGLLMGPTAAIGYTIVALGFTCATFIGVIFSGAIPNR